MPHITGSTDVYAQQTSWKTVMKNTAVDTVEKNWQAFTGQSEGFSSDCFNQPGLSIVGRKPA